MPTYRYRCNCGHQEDAIRAIADRDDAPLHCSLPMERRIMPTLISTGFTPYRTAAFDKEQGKPLFIRSREEHQAFLRRNGYEEVGNDRSMAPPCEEEIRELQKRPVETDDTTFDLTLEDVHLDP